MAHVAARSLGPLSLPAVQYFVIAVGAYTLLPPGSTVISVLDSMLQVARQVSAAGGTRGGISYGTGDSNLPIVINMPNQGGTSILNQGKTMSLLIQASLAAATCWAGYGLIINLLPESLQECLPVSKRIFDGAVQSLAKGILNVKDTLCEAIGIVDVKVDKLAIKQDETLDELLGMKNDIDNLKLDVNSVHETVKRCESELARASRRQSYTARGVRLLISCVGALMPANASLASELTKFNKQSSGSFDADDETKTNAVGVVEEMKKKYEKSHHLPRSISEVDDAGDSPEDIVTPKKQMAPTSNIKSPMTPQQEAMGDSQKSLDEVRALLAGVGGSALNMVSPVKGY